MGTLHDAVESGSWIQNAQGALGLRPNYHQLEKRVEGHIFISILAYHLLNWVHLRLQGSEDNRDWRSIRRLVSTHLPLEDAV